MQLGHPLGRGQWVCARIFSDGAVLRPNLKGRDRSLSDALVAKEHHPGSKGSCFEQFELHSLRWVIE